jgi:hypothetical protein
MISLFNGRTRSLGSGGKAGVFAQVDVSFRGYLHLMKGAHLGVFLAIALHADGDGWAWPSYATLARETGYSEDTIRRALAHLCELEINGHRVLLRYQPKGEEGTFQSNRYLLFPSREEVARYEGRGVTHLGAGSGGGFDDRGGKTPPRPPWWEKPSSEKPTTKKNHDKQERDDEDDRAPPEEPVEEPVRPNHPAGPAPPDPVLAEVVQLYEAEIGVVTEGVAQRLLALAGEHRDPDRWRRAFDAVVGSNVRRLDYLETCLANDGRPRPKRERRSGSGRRRRARAKASAGSNPGRGVRRGRVVSPEEMPEVEPEAPLPLP